MAFLMNGNLSNSFAEGLCGEMGKKVRKEKSQDKANSPQSVQVRSRTRGSTNVFGVLVKAGLDELFELLAEVAGQLRWVVFRYQEEHSHRVEIGVRRFAFSQFDGRYAQRPDVGL